MSTIAVASPAVAAVFPAANTMNMWDKVYAVAHNLDFIAVTIFATIGFSLTIILTVYLGPQDDPAALHIQVSEASQIKVAQINSGRGSASPAESNADRTDVTSAVAPPQQVSDAASVELVDDQPLLATGLDLNGPPKRFPAKETPGQLEMRAF
jgi:hypothetical protein